MSETREIRVAAIMAELRSEIRKARAKLSEEDRAATYAGQRSGDPPGPTSDNNVKADLAVLKQEYNILGAPFFSHRGVLGRSIILIKNFSRNLLSQILWRQVTYNAANTRLINHLEQQVEALRMEVSRLSTRLEAKEKSQRTDANVSSNGKHRDR